MALPNHRYFTLEQAAELAKCKVDDLIHFASIGLLQLSFKIPDIELFIDYPDGDGEPKKLDVESSSSLAIDRDGNYLANYENESDEDTPTDHGLMPVEGSEHSRQWFRFYYRSDYFNIIERYEPAKDKKNIERWGGLLAIPQEFIEAEERFLSKYDDWSFTVCELFPPRCKNFECHEKYRIGTFLTDGWYTIKREELLITAYEFDLLTNGGEQIEINHILNEKKPVNSHKRTYTSPVQSSLIYQLIQLAFHDDGGISKLSYESIAEQIQRKLIERDIHHSDVSPYNIRNWIGRYKDK